MSTNPEKLSQPGDPGLMQENNDREFREEEISRLLRFKRYELPPPGFHEDFLAEFQRRQRVESMRPGFWEQLQERFGELIERVRVPGYAYATVGLFAIAAGSWILSSEEIGNGGAYTQQAGLAAASAPVQELKMDISSAPPSALPNPVNIPTQRFVGTLPPRYLLQSRPTSQNDPFSF
jgi:hypothetical protein